ncbi:hypothetical protein Y1Q_0003397 [Alligator mississippiensis]|uniref:Uncharacterized protein n=1 Tax=Alligator mississippiensis TaxID=8496 RepID=A0A151PG77_ALLMI|nr:hypothetical protein Y1Q_0003397 [Alligator mississippiensis]
MCSTSRKLSPGVVRELSVLARACVQQSPPLPSQLPHSPGLCAEKHPEPGVKADEGKSHSLAGDRGHCPGSW